MLKKLIAVVFVFCVGCVTASTSIRSYRQAVKEYNREYIILKIMPDDKYIVVSDKKGNIKVVAVDRETKQVVNEITIKEADK